MSVHSWLEAFLGNKGFYREGGRFGCRLHVDAVSVRSLTKCGQMRIWSCFKEMSKYDHVNFPLNCFNGDYE